MGFTIKCNKCGNEQIFTQGMGRWSDNIEFEVETHSTFVGTSVEGITIYCENVECNQYIELNY